MHSQVDKWNFTPYFSQNSTETRSPGRIVVNLSIHTALSWV
jgi:hypothetical protein